MTNFAPDEASHAGTGPVSGGPAGSPPQAAEFARFCELHALATSTDLHIVPPATLDEYQRLLVRYGVFVVDGVGVGPSDPTRPPGSDPILSTDCVPIPGPRSLVCPRSAPRLPAELLPGIDARFRQLGLIGPGRSVLWVGRQDRMETVCMYEAGCGCFASPPLAPPPPAAPPLAEQPEPDGPFGVDGFRYRGAEVRFGRAALQRRLALALWDDRQGRPAGPRPASAVMAAVYGHGHKTSEVAFRQLLSDTRRRLDAADVPLAIEHAGGVVVLTPRP